MATRMQQRRGTALQWTTANPILNAGEIGWESDTNRFRIGDGVNHWDDLQMFYNNADLVTSIDAAIEAVVGMAPETLDTLAEVASALNDDPAFFTTISGNISDVSDNLSNHASDTTNIHGIADTGALATTEYVDDQDLLKLDKSQFNAKGDMIVASANDTPATLSVGTNGYLLTANSSATNGIEWAPAPVSLPDQSGNSGEFLTTDGTTASWATAVTLDATQTLSNKTLENPTLNLEYEDTGLPVSFTIGTVELSYLDNVSSNIQTQLNAKASDSALSSLSTTVDGKLDLSGGTMTGAITLSGAPSSDLHAATKAYVDSVAEGLHIHASVSAATTTNVTLATALENGDVLDGVTLATNNRILVKNQTTQSENGIYIVQASGQPTRATDFDTALEVDSGDFVFVSGGTVNANTGWVQTSQPATIGTDPITFSQFSGAGTYLAGTGLTLTGNTFSINTGTTVDLSTAQTLTNKKITAPRLQVAIKNETGTSYTLDVTDASNKWVTISNSSAITVTVPPSVFEVGDQINVQQIGSGQITFQQGSGVTITAAAGTPSAPKIRAQYASATVICVASNSFTIVGDLI